MPQPPPHQCAHAASRGYETEPHRRPLFTDRHAPDRPLNAVGVRRRLRELARDTGLTFAPHDLDAQDLVTVHDLEAEQWRFSTAA